MWVVWHYPVGTPVLVELFFIAVTRFEFFRINWVMFSWQMVLKFVRSTFLHRGFCTSEALSGVIRANRFARLARIGWFSRIRNSSDSCESAWRAMKIGASIANESRANRVANLSRNPNLGPNSGKRILDARILRPNSWVEFLILFFPAKATPWKIHPQEIHLSKCTFQNSIRNLEKYSHWTSAGPFGW